MTDIVDLGATVVAVRAAHERCRAAAYASLEAAREAGELLQAVKSQVPHGAWGAWIRDSCGFSERLAQTYMQIAREWSRLIGPNPQRVAGLSIRQAIALLSSPRSELDRADIFSRAYESWKVSMRVEVQALEDELADEHLDLARVVAVQSAVDALLHAAVSWKARAEREAGRILRLMEQGT